MFMKVTLNPNTLHTGDGLFQRYHRNMLELFYRWNIRQIDLQHMDHDFEPMYDGADPRWHVRHEAEENIWNIIDIYGFPTQHMMID